MEKVDEVRTGNITFWWFIAGLSPAILTVIAQTVLGVFGSTVTDLFKGFPLDSSALDTRYNFGSYAAQCYD